MALWHRLNQSKLNFLSRQLRRYYIQTPHASVPNYSVKNTSSYVLTNPVRDVCRRPTDMCYSVRFFATSHKAKVKKDEKYGGCLLNDEIKAQFVRLVIGEEHFVVSLREARERAKKLDLDLVQVQGNADPPVCKIMDYKRELYKRKMKQKDRAKEKKNVTVKKGGCKEVRFLEKTELKDLKIKADSVVRLMERGYRVKCMAVGNPKKGGRAAASFKGADGEKLTEEEIAELRRQEEEEEKERLKVVLSRLTALLGEEYILESGPWAEKKQAYVIVRHAKFGPKKGGGSAKKTKDASNSGSAGSSAIAEEESEEESLSDEDGENVWSLADSTDEFDSSFDIKIDAEETCQNQSVQPEVKSFSTISNIPDASQFRPVHDLKQQKRVSPLQQQQFEENRYQRSEPRQQFQSTPPSDNRALDAARGPIFPRQSSEGENRYRRNEPREQYQPTPPRDGRAFDPARVPYPPQSFEGENRYKRSEPREQFQPTPPRDSRVPYPPQQSFEGVNRYKRSEPREQFPPTPPRDTRAPPPQFPNQSGREPYPSTFTRDNRAPDRPDLSRVSPPQFSNQNGRIQPGVNLSPATGERRPPQSDPSALRTAELQKQSNTSNVPNTRSSYGIFSRPNAGFPGKPGVPSQGNEKAESTGGNSNTGGLGSGQGPKDDGGQQPRWGIFSKDDPNSNPSRVSK